MHERFAVALIGIAASATIATAVGIESTRIEVGPNILVSYGSVLPHVETTVAANPKRSRNLIGGAITTWRGDGGWASRAYVSDDGGYSWNTPQLPDPNALGLDPQVGFGPDGTAYFVSLGT